MERWCFNIARLWQSGFELNSINNDVEWTQNIGSPSIQSSTVRTGGFAMQATGFSSGVQISLVYRFNAANVNGPFFYRTYFQYATLPSATNRIIKIQDGNPTSKVWINLTSTGTLTLNDTGGQIGSASSVLSANTWYNIEIKIDLTPAAGSQIVEARLNGSVFATSSARTVSGVALLSVGGNLGLETQTIGNWFFDDVAINDNTGSFQTGYPGEGKIIHLKPNAQGDSNGFSVAVGGTAGASNNFTRVKEVTPDDATSYNASAVLNAEDLFNCDDSGIGAADIVNVVAVGVRFADLVATDATAGIKLEIEKTTSGTKTRSANLVPNSTAFVTNQALKPRNYPLVTYQDPDGSNWTQTTLDSMQIGYIEDVANVDAIAVSTVWASIDYTPAPPSSYKPNNLSLLGIG